MRSWRIIIFLCVLCFSSSAFAEDLYYAESAAGSENGSSCANALDIDTITWGVGAGNIGPGDTAHLCGTITGNLTIGASGTDLTTGAITIKFESGAVMEAAVWTTAGSAAIYCTGYQYIIIDGGTNGIIRATANGVGLANTEHGYGIDLQCDNSEVKNLAITDIFQRDGGSDEEANGICIRANGANNIYIHDNAVSEANTGIKTQDGEAGNGHYIYNNTVTEVSNGIIVGTSGGGSIDIVKIYSNTINLGTSWDGQFVGGDCHHADGIQVYSTVGGGGITNLEIYKNTLGPVWPMKTALLSATTSPIFTEDYVRGMAYNNLVLVNGTSKLSNPAVNLGGTTSWATHAFNNTVISSSGDHTCFYVQDTGQAKNNICIDVGYGATVENIVSASQIDYNVYTTYDDGFYDPDVGIYNWASWTAAGYDAHSKTSTPTFAETTYYRLAAGDTVAKDSGTSLSGYFTTDKDGNTRSGTWDIGAYEYGSGVTAPTALGVSLSGATLQ